MGEFLDGLEKLVFKIQARNIKQAVIGTLDANGNPVLTAPGRPDNYVPVRVIDGQEGSTVSVALNLGVAPIFDTQVRLQRDPVYSDQWNIVQVDPKFQLANPTNSPYNVTFHRHYIGSGLDDPVEVRRLIPCRTWSSGGLSINVDPFSYQWNGTNQYFGGVTNYDVSSHVPGSSLQCFLVVTIDPSTNSLYLIDGPTFSSASAPTFAALLSISTGSNIVSAGIALAHGQTTIIESNIYDLRPFVSAVASSILTSIAVTAPITNTGTPTAPIIGIATGATLGQPLLAGATAPAYGALDLANTNAITGIAPVTHGGSGAATLTAHALIIGNGTSAVNSLAPGTSGNLVVSNGTDFVSTNTLPAPIILTPQAAPSTAEGKVYYDSTAHALEYYNGSAWVTLTADTGITQLTGDVTAGPGSGSQAATLATVNSNVGSFAIATLTVNAKGLVTAASAAATTGSGNVVLASTPTIASPVINTGVSGSAISTDGTFASPSDTILASQKAIKTYVDAVATGLSPKASVRLATTAALPSSTYNNGSAGVGATLTGSATGVLTVDGQTVTLNDPVLVKDEATPANNGIYVCTTAGAVGVAFVLTRRSDADTGAEVLGSYVFVEVGTANASAGFVNTNATSPTIGSTGITWTQFTGAGEINAGIGLSKSGNTLSIDSTVVTLTGTQALTNKTLTSPTIAKIGNLTTNGFVKTSGGDGTLTVDTSTYLTGNQTITLSGDATGSGATSIAVTLASVGSAGTYTKVTTDAQGRVTSGTTLSASDIPSLDASKIATGVFGTSQIATSWKQPVQAVATANVTISGPGATLDGYTLVSGDRILLTAQSTASQNGLWVFNGSAAALTRPTDYAAGSTSFGYYGVTVYVINGTVGAGQTWRITTTAAITVDTTSVTWVQSAFSVASGGVTGVIPNANVNWAAPGTLGSTTPNMGAFTALTAGSGAFSVGTGGNLALVSTTASTSQVSIKSATGQTSAVPIVIISDASNNTLWQIDKNGLVQSPDTLRMVNSIGGTTYLELTSAGFTKVTGGTTLATFQAGSTRGGAAAVVLEGASSRPIQVGIVNGVEVGPILTTSASVVPLIARAASSQSVDVVEIQDSGSISRVFIASNFSMTVAPIDTGTNAVLNAFTVGHNSSGTPVPGFGPAIQIQAQSSANANRNIGRFRWLWTNATDSSGNLAMKGVASGYYNASGTLTEVDAMAWGVNGSGAPLWAVYGATPVVQATTAIAAATFVANTSGIANDTATWDGYTFGQVVKAIRNAGILA